VVYVGKIQKRDILINFARQRWSVETWRECLKSFPCTVIGYQSKQDGANMPARDNPFPARKWCSLCHKKSFIHRGCLVKKTGYKLRLAFAQIWKEINSRIRCKGTYWVKILYMFSFSLTRTKGSAPAFSMRILNSRAGRKNTLRISCPCGPCCVNCPYFVWLKNLKTRFNISRELQEMIPSYQKNSAFICSQPS